MEFSLITAPPAHQHATSTYNQTLSDAHSDLHSVYDALIVKKSSTCFISAQV